MVEKERKFLVKPGVNMDDYPEDVSIHIEQMYLMRNEEQMVRARREYVRVGESALTSCTMTYKHRISDTECTEIETYITEEEFEYLKGAGYPSLEKERRILRSGWEVDTFLSGPKEGQTLLEIEDDDVENIELPEFVGKEVTGDPEWINSNML